MVSLSILIQLVLFLSLLPLIYSLSDTCLAWLIYANIQLSHEKCSSSSRRHMEQHYMKRQQHQHNMTSSNSASGSKSRFDSGGLGKSHHHKYGKGSSSHELDYDLREIIDDEDGDMLMADDHHCMGDDSPPGSSNLLDVCTGLFVIYIFRFCLGFSFFRFLLFTII